MKLTDIACRNSKPKQKNYKLRDGKGLYLLVMTSGGKSWRYDYKLKKNNEGYKNGTYVIGSYPQVKLSEARELHKKVHKLVSQGVDPNYNKKAETRKRLQDQAMTFETIARQWLDKRRGEVKPKTLKDIQKRLIIDVFPEIGSIAIKDIDAPTLLSMIKKVEKRGAYEMANRARQYCSQILRYAIALGLAERDFTVDISDALKTHRVKHQPALSPNEISDFLKALDKNDARLFPQTRVALKMLMLTFVRPIELASAEWIDFDFQDKRWIIPANKMKMGFDHIVPLSAQMIELLKEQKEFSSKRQYVFPQKRNPRQHMSRDTLSSAIRSLGFQGRHTAHGFRALARTTIREKLSWDSEIIERQLAHAPKSSLGRAYDRTQFLEQRTEMMQEWADYIDSLI